MLPILVSLPLAFTMGLMMRRGQKHQVSPLSSWGFRLAEGGILCRWLFPGYRKHLG